MPRLLDQRQTDDISCPGFMRKESCLQAPEGGPAGEIAGFDGQACLLTAFVQGRVAELPVLAGAGILASGLATTCYCRKMALNFGRKVQR